MLEDEEFTLLKPKYTDRGSTVVILWSFSHFESLAPYTLIVILLQADKLLRVSFAYEFVIAK